jgi:D-serine deaminase-like pyridoxal phosphate-dependent protein
VNIGDLRTPCVLIDHVKVDRNIDKMQQAAEASRLRLRPHAKTHKSPDLALIQMARGAVGICCAKLGEAEVFADHGVGDIRLPYPLNPVSADRVIALLERVALSFIVDELNVARGWSEAMRRAGRSVDILVKVDVGLHRCGIDPNAPGAAELVVGIAELPGLRFRGLLSHAGHAYGASTEQDLSAIASAEAETLTTLRDQVQSAGVAVNEISVGATPTARFSARLPGLTEIRPGNYVYYDRTQVALGGASWDECALTVLARVVSRPARDRIILDSGSKTLTSDLARGFVETPGYGAVMKAIDTPEPDAGLLIERLSEEHATVRVLDSASSLQPGDLVRIVPNHSCVVSNLVDQVWVVDGNAVRDRVPVAARGRIE